MNWTRADRRWWLAFVLPSFALLSVFTVIPILAAGWLSFYDWDLLSPPKFVGGANFIELVRDSEFLQALGHTIVFIAGYVPVVMVLGVGLAVLLNRKRRFGGLTKTLFFMPVVSAWVAVSLMWNWMLNPRFGVVNWALALIGVDGPAWLFERGWAMVAIIGVSVWKDIGFVMLLALAGLQTVPAEYREAALVDGAGRWRTLWRITLPLLTPTIFLIMIILLINSFQVFEQVWIMTGGGPAESTTVVVEQIVRNAFSYGRMGYAAAMSWVLFALIFGITVVQSRLQKRWVFYDR